MSNDWQPYYGWRSFDEQRALYDQGRKDSGSIVTNSEPGKSPHNWGCASDWTIFVNKQFDWNHFRWNEYEWACNQLGLKWAPMFKTPIGKLIKDYVHNELKIGIAWHEVYDIYLKDGAEVTNKVITSSLAN